MLIPLYSNGLADWAPPVRRLARVQVRRGFSDAYSDASMLTSTGGAIAGGTVGILASGSAPIISAATASVALPLIGVGVAAIIATIYLIKNSGCGNTCIVTANDANKIEPYLQANLKGYFEGPRTLASQQAALLNFDNFWNYLVEACGQPSNGNAGKTCISDRAAGSCKWQQTSSSPYPGTPQIGQCWNWFSGYRDPIANDPNVVASPSLSDVLSAGQASVIDQAFIQAGLPATVGGMPWSQLLIPAALLVALVVVNS